MWSAPSPDVGRATVASDVRAGAAAEARFGAGRGVDPFVYVSVGTGVSSTLVQGGDPYAGRHGSALVAASGTFSTTCPHCGELVEVVPEDVASGLGMVRRMRDRRPDASFDRAEDVLAAADAGDDGAREIVDEGGRMLGSIVAGLINVLDPEAVVIGGGLGLAAGRYRERFEASLAEHIWAPTSRSTPILDAALGADAVLIGAALAADTAVAGRRPRDRRSATCSARDPGAGRRRTARLPSRVPSDRRSRRDRRRVRPG